MKERLDDPQSMEERPKRYYTLYGRLLSREALHKGFQQVKRARGAAGIDKQSLSEFEERLDEELGQLLEELVTKSYKPLPVRRVEIPKPQGGTRQLGIPTVRDRVVQSALRDVLEPIFDPYFHPSSYGYRPGRSCHGAISKATQFIRQYGREWVVDMDLSRCFDTLNHDLIIEAFRRRVSDGSILGLLRQFLESGVMTTTGLEETSVGSPQGGSISPLISNVYLDSFDQEMKRRGHRIVRYCDDILILCCSKSAADHARDVAVELLEGPLRLSVNREKTYVAHSSKGINFLGVSIFTGYMRIQSKKVESFKGRVRELTKRQNRNISDVVRRLNHLLRGFANYFRISNCSRTLQTLMQWIRRRIRSIQLAQWKRVPRLLRRLRQVGYYTTVGMAMRRWRSSASPLASLAMPNSWIHGTLGLFDMGTIRTGMIVSV